MFKFIKDSLLSQKSLFRIFPWFYSFFSSKSPFCEWRSTLQALGKSAMKTVRTRYLFVSIWCFSLGELVKNWIFGHLFLAFFSVKPLEMSPTFEIKQSCNHILEIKITCFLHHPWSVTRNGHESFEVVKVWHVFMVIKYSARS